jgi:hypothetical protein
LRVVDFFCALEAPDVIMHDMEITET